MGGHFSPALFAFLRDLKKHNDREWFADQKSRYTADVEAPFLQFIGDFANREDRTSPLVVQVHETAASWLQSEFEGILPLAKAFFPLLQFADSIVARSAAHAEKIANETFIYPAERFGLDCFAAEQAANGRISIA